MAFFRKVVAGLVKSDINDFVGERGNIFFDVETGEFRLSDGVTPGGIPLGGGGGGGGYVLPTASTTVKGGVKIDGTTIQINGQGVIRGFDGNYANLQNKPTLSTVATSGNYNDLTNKPAPYTLPTASNTVLGGVKVGTGLSISNGVLSVLTGATLPIATSTTLGGVKIGSGLSIDQYSGILTTSFNGDYGSLTGAPTSLSSFTNDPGYITSSALPTDISQLTDNNGLLQPGLEVSQVELDGSVTHSYSNITAIRFDTDSGFEVTDLGSGAIKVGMNSTFKTWKVDGEQDLVAQGLDTIRFVAGSGIEITTDPTAGPKTITFTSTSSGGASTSPIKTFNILNEFSAPLLGKAVFVPAVTDTIRSVRLTTGQAVNSDLMVGLYRNEALLGFYSIPAGHISYNYSGLNYPINPNDYITVSVVSGSGLNFSMGLYNIDT